MAYLDIAPTIAALRARPEEFDLVRGWLRHTPSNHRFKVDPRGDVQLEAGCDCVMLSVSRPQGQELYAVMQDPLVNEGSGNRDHWFAGWEVQRQLSDHWTVGAEVFASGAQVIGQRRSAGFNVGGYYVFGERDQALFSLGRGLSSVHETNRVSAYVGYQRSF